MSSSHDITLTPQEQALIMRLKSFRVPEMAHILEEQLKDPNADLNTFMERMTAMVDAEWQARADKRFNRLMKEAHLRYPAADLDETIYRPERQLDTQTIERLSTCQWIEEGKNLIVTGSSASGKTYLINAFCVTAMKQSTIFLNCRLFRRRYRRFWKTKSVSSGSLQSMPMHMMCSLLAVVSTMQSAWKVA